MNSDAPHPVLVAERDRDLSILGPRPPWWRPWTRARHRKLVAAVMSYDVSSYGYMQREFLREMYPADAGNNVKVDLDDLEAKALSALDPSPWRIYRCRGADEADACAIKAEPFVSESEDACQRGIVHDTNRDECSHHMSLIDAEHIVANEPRMTLALVARIRELEAALKEKP